MDKAKAAVHDFMAKAGKHDTTVHENVAPAVKHETIKPQRHENITTAVDKEVHQDHYHHSVQPVFDREVLPEQHTAKLGAVEHRDHDHRNDTDVSRKLELERAKFKDEQVVHDARHTQSISPTVAGEHVHHHVHETIQPVVQKEIIQPSVVHTTVPIHEVHHNAAQHHSTTELPAVSMSEFKNQGGVLGGREERYDEFKGEPRNIGGALGSHHHDHDRVGTHGGLGNTTDHHSHGGLGNTTDRAHGGLGNTTDRSHAGLGNTSDRSHGLGNSAEGRVGNNNPQKASLTQKLNPFSDSDRDGKKGIME